MKLIKELKSRKVTSLNGNTRTRRFAMFECDTCGNIEERKRDDGLKQKRCCGGKSLIAHRGSPLYNRFVGMTQRCRDSNAINYKNYGGRGISVCREWRNFDNFAKWSLENGFREDLQLNRIDNNGHYCPSNCNYITRAENAQNTRANIHTPSEIRQIREDYSSGRYTTTELSKKYNDSRGNIHNIISGRSWRNITQDEVEGCMVSIKVI